MKAQDTPAQQREWRFSAFDCNIFRGLGKTIQILGIVIEARRPKKMGLTLIIVLNVLLGR